MLGERQFVVRSPDIDIIEPDEWDLDVRLGELGTVSCGCGEHDLIDLVPTGAEGGTCNTQNNTCPGTCAGHGTCPHTQCGTCGGTCRATCGGTCRTCEDFTCGGTCANTHCFTCRGGCQEP